MQSFKRNRFLYLLLLFLNFAAAQKYPSKNYSTLDGLSSNYILALYKDSRNILWAGTNNGLAKIVNHDIQNLFEKDGLAFNNCWDIIEDANKNLWFASYGGGLTFYDGKNFKIFNTKNGLVDDLVRKLFVFNNTIYVATHDGISIININNHQIKNFVEKKKNKANFQAMDFFNINNDVYFNTYKDGCWKINKDKITLVRPNSQDIFSSYQYENKIAIGVLEKNSKTYTLKIYDKTNYIKGKNPEKIIGNTIFWRFSKSKNHFFATGNGITFDNGGLFEIKNDSIKNSSKIYGVETTSPWSILYDNATNKLYTGSTYKGLYVTDLLNEILFYERENPNQVNAIQSLNNNLLFLDFKNLEIRKNNKITQQFSLKDFYKIANNFISKNSNKYNSLPKNFKFNVNDNSNRLLKIKIIDDKIWINSTFGIFVFDQNLKPENYFHFESVDFELDSDNEILFQKAYSTTFKTKNKSKNDNIVEFNLNNKNTPRDICNIIKNKDKIYFFSESNGIYKYLNGNFSSYLHKGIWKEKNLTFAKKINEQQIAISNAQGDVFIIDTNLGFRVIKKIDREVLFGKTITFLETYKNNLLIATEKGINLYNGKTIRLIDDEIGFKDNAFTSGLVVKNNLYIGTTKGYYQFDLERYLSKKIPQLNVSISNFEINYKRVTKENFSFFELNKKEFELPHNKNTLSISFVPKNHPYPNKLLFRYKVIGLSNANWSNFSNTKTITLPFLPRGDFDIIIETKDLYSGIISSHKILTITILPPFWKTWWFIGLVTLILIVLGYIVSKKRIENIKNHERAKSEIQKRFVETKMEALQSQMNPHFIFNAMNSIQNYIIDNNTDDALMYMGEFSKLIRQTLNNSSKSKIPLLEELKYIESYVTLENMRFKNKIKFEKNIDTAIDLSSTLIPPMLIQPFLENAFAHAFDSNSENPKLLFSITKKSKNLLIEIKDNGKGIVSYNLNKFTTSKGIKLAKERISLYENSRNNSVSIYSEINKGTTIILEIHFTKLR